MLRKAAYHYFLFLIWPLLSLVDAITNFRKPYSKILFVLVFSFIGFTSTSEGDLARYEDKFYTFRSNTIGELFQSYANLEKVDIYIDLASIVIGLFSNSHHVFFAVLFGVFGFLLISIIEWFYLKIPHQINSYFLFTFLGFCLFYSIRSIISVRFYTGGLFYLYMILKYQETRHLKYLCLSFLTPLFHYAHGVTVVATMLWLFLRRNIPVAMLLAVISFLVNQNDAASFLGKNIRRFDSSVLEQRYNSYASVRGKERFDLLYEQRYLNYNWKAKALEQIRNLLLQLVMGGVFLIYVFRRKVIKYKIEQELFVLVLNLFLISNLMLNVSNGVRYIYTFGFLAFGIFNLVISKFNFWVRSYFVLTGVIGCIYGLMAIYAANPLFTFDFFFGNYLTVIAQRVLALSMNF